MGRACRSLLKEDQYSKALYPCSVCGTPQTVVEEMGVCDTCLHEIAMEDLEWQAHVKTRQEAAYLLWFSVGTTL